ncbi:unnamed protein product [Lepeophtheirus salmonis]|uniref:(salmon louse) hypothetical protein n=1 Tax=Lepeophtheirus salmonis TaxID=72036 RepID=A0A7R8GZH4_LEPSM|nr:unnamed protein product [Lepeophtheirus salmonis]CAF2752875.1 unnamed protein product [Lepeophtheirus salmonis]
MFSPQSPPLGIWKTPHENWFGYSFLQIAYVREIISRMTNNLTNRGVKCSSKKKGPATPAHVRGTATTTVKTNLHRRTTRQMKKTKSKKIWAMSEVKTLIARKRDSGVSLDEVSSSGFEKKKNGHSAQSRAGTASSSGLDYAFWCLTRPTRSRTQIFVSLEPGLTSIGTKMSTDYIVNVCSGIAKPIKTIVKATGGHIEKK